MKTRGALLVLTLLLAGCSTLAAPREEPAPSRVADVRPLEHAMAPRAPPVYVSSRPIEVNVSATALWVRPGEAIEATATAPGAAAIAWFFASRNPELPGASTTFGRKLPPLAIPPGETIEIVISRPLRHVLGLDAAHAGRLNVTGVGTPTLGAVLVTLSGSADDPRFFPDDVQLPVGGRLIVRNALDARATLRGLDVMAPVGSDARVSFPATRELGDYDLVAVAADRDGGRGEASIRVIVDKRKPDEIQTLGPWTGTILRPALGLPDEEPSVHAFTLAHPARAFTIMYNATSPAPVEPVVRLRVLDKEGAEIATGEGNAGAIDVGATPAGAYRLVVETTSGANVRYAADARVELDLVPPASFFND